MLLWRHHFTQFPPGESLLPLCPGPAVFPVLFVTCLSYPFVVLTPASHLSPVCRHRFYSSTMLVLGIKLSSLGLVASTVKPESSPSFSLVPQAILTAGRIQCFSLEGLRGPRDPAKHEGSSLICFALTLRDAPTPCFLIL